MRKHCWKVGIVICFALILFLGVTTPKLALAKPSETGSLQVTGSAVVTGTPDIAYITVGVETKDASAELAAQENARLMNEVFSSLKSRGLTDQELTTSGYNIYSSTQTQNRGTTEEVTFTTYHVVNKITITTKDLLGVGEFIDTAVKAGANQVHGIRFDIENKQDLQLQALELAVKQAMNKAAIMAAAAEITLGGITSINENYSSYAPVVNTMALRADAAMSTTINPGDVEVSATVNLDYWF